ncbi:MAG: ATP-binding cassette domain-containing protein [Cyclobacteriaceae bacterium]
MHSDQILEIIKQSSIILKHKSLTLSNISVFNRFYEDHEKSEFVRDLVEQANEKGIVYLENELPEEEFINMMRDVHIPILAFEWEDDRMVPIIFMEEGRKKQYMKIRKHGDVELITLDKNTPYPNLVMENGTVSFLGIFYYKSLVSDTDDEERKKLTPIQRLIRLLSEEQRDIMYIYFYAVLIGLISLTLPVGIQATVSLISGGVVFSSVYVLIGLVIAGVMAAGGLQITQITLVEYLQRRVFTKAAFEFAFRIPRIKAEALINYHAPELMNRFFDVLTIQKGLPKLLIDLSAGAIQIFFGLILLSFYHPFFVFFSLLLLGLLFFIFYTTGPKGLRSSINESKYKYKVVYWLEELARTINSFKLSGNTPLPMKKTDYNVNNYLKNRKIHFSVLIKQYSFVLLFKTLVTGGLLIIGTILVISREITLGQFVAAEVIIILTLSSVEKIIMYMDVVYDMLTAVDKISVVTDLPLERMGGLDLPGSMHNRGYHIRSKGLKYRFPDKSDYVLKGVDIDIKPGQSVCIAGSGGSGRRVLTNTIAGFNNDFEGVLTFNGYSMRDLDLMNLRDMIGKNPSQEDVFEGSILENITLLKPNSHLEDAIWAMETVGISDNINAMPQGLDTQMLSSGKNLSRSMVNKIILARCLAKRPSLLILNDFFNDFPKSEKEKLIRILASKEQKWTLLVVSNDPVIMEGCERVLVMANGNIEADGSYQELNKSGRLSSIMN